jgi:hypothetical protein
MVQHVVERIAEVVLEPSAAVDDAVLVLADRSRAPKGHGVTPRRQSGRESIDKDL